MLDTFSPIFSSFPLFVFAQICVNLLLNLLERPRNASILTDSPEVHRHKYNDNKG